MSAYETITKQRAAQPGPVVVLPPTYSGPLGAYGYEGAQGDPGLVGMTGPVGPTGATGAQGVIDPNQIIDCGVYP
jgi:hypothetical protein